MWEGEMPTCNPQTDRWSADGNGDIVQWLISAPFRRVVEWVRGDDRRRLDYDLEQKIQGMMQA